MNIIFVARRLEGAPIGMPSFGSSSTDGFPSVALLRPSLIHGDSETTFQDGSDDDDGSRLVFFSLFPVASPSFSSFSPADIETLDERHLPSRIFPCFCCACVVVLCERRRLVLYLLARKMHSEDFEQQDEDEDTSPTAPFCDDVCIVVVISFQSKSRLSKQGWWWWYRWWKNISVVVSKACVCSLSSVQRCFCSGVR